MGDVNQFARECFDHVVIGTEADHHRFRISPVRQNRRGPGGMGEPTKTDRAGALFLDVRSPNHENITQAAGKWWAGFSRFRSATAILPSRRGQAIA